MAKKKQTTKQVRLSLKYYEQLRRAAFRRRVPMAKLLAEIVDYYQNEL
jgi:predicted DNA-binding ribbon-helix-helix protein